MSPSFLIGLAFSTTFGALLFTQLLAVDLLRLYRALVQEVSSDVGHDTRIFPDYEP